MIEPQSAPRSTESMGVVVIGRNEGERLERCLASLGGLAKRTVYVDSGSNDGSLDRARRRDAAVVELDISAPFTAARARNTGFRTLVKLHPELRFVFFVDGDCEVAEGWTGKAVQFLEAHPDVAVVWGRRRERFPERSVYNLLCDIEWSDTPIGETKACGGDIVMRVDAFRQVGGYRPDLICGEEPEMCVRLRALNWRIWRIDADMTLHDAAIYRFGQWWKRMLRGGYGFAQGAQIHGAPPERHCVGAVRRIWRWGLIVPLGIVLVTLLIGWPGWLLWLVYPAQVVRLALRGKRAARDNWWRALFLVLCNFPEMVGQLKFARDRFSKSQSALIEYK